MFKSDYIRIGSGCSIACGAFVHYGVTMGDQVVLEADSFLMKGETLDPSTTWRGNPARSVGGNAGQDSALRDTAAQRDRSEAHVPGLAA